MKCIILSKPLYVWEKNVPSTKRQNRLKVCLPFIEISSNEGDLVLDPFMGSGSTAVAAKMLKRNFIGYELSAEFCKIADQRLTDTAAK